MILLTRALYNMPEPDTQAMKETLSSLSGKLVGEAELILAEREGISVNKKKLEIIAEEERLIREVCGLTHSARHCSIDYEVGFFVRAGSDAGGTKSGGHCHNGNIPLSDAGHVNQ